MEGQKRGEKEDERRRRKRDGECLTQIREQDRKRRNRRKSRRKTVRLAFSTLLTTSRFLWLYLSTTQPFPFFSSPLLSDSASLLAVTDASSLLFVLAFFNVIFLVFVSGQCLCSREFSTSNLRLHDIHFSMFLCVSRRRCFIAQPSALFLICTPSLKHKILETAAAQSSVFLNLPVKQHVRSQQGQ